MSQLLGNIIAENHEFVRLGDGIGKKKGLVDGNFVNPREKLINEPFALCNKEVSRRIATGLKIGLKIRKENMKSLVWRLMSNHF